MRESRRRGGAGGEPPDGAETPGDAISERPTVGADDSDAPTLAGGETVDHAAFDETESACIAQHRIIRKLGEDGGASWTDQARVPEEAMLALFALNEGHAWAVGEQQRRGIGPGTQKLLRYRGTSEEH
jgi:hypothetical protein